MAPLLKYLALAAMMTATWAGTVRATPCSFDKADMLDGFSALDAMAYLDLPDPDALRVTQVVEDSFVVKMIAGDIGGFSKTWCRIGVQSSIIDFDVPVEDDAIRSILTRVVYEWKTTPDAFGWQISALGERSICARGDDPFAIVCP
jgi:hypothetical protein